MPASKADAWPDDLIVRLRAGWDEGHSAAEIGRRIGKSASAVVAKAHRLDLPGRPSPIKRGAPPKVRPAPRAGATTLPPLPSLANDA